MPVKSYAVRLLIDEFDFSTDSNSLGMSFAAEELPASSFQVPAKQSIPTAGQNSLNHGGYYTGGTAGNMAEELRTRLASGIAAWVIVLFGTVTIPSVAYVRKGAWMGQLTMEAPIRELLTVQGSWLSIPTWRGLAIVDHDLEENHAGAFVDFKASGPDGGKIVIQTSVLSGGNVTVTVKSSAASNGSGAVPLDPIIIDEIGVVEVDIDEAVARYIAADVTFEPGATAARISVIVVVDGVTSTL
jgi:hypothetical protein